MCRDEDYIKTDEYALQKARQENILLGSKYKNWTIIRPYITYNKERLQLGVLEKKSGFIELYMIGQSYLHKILLIR